MSRLYNMGTMLANGLRLPVHILRPGLAPVAIPEEQGTASRVLFGENRLEAISRAVGQYGVAQYLRTVYDEYFIYIPTIYGADIWLGPVVLKPVLEGRVQELIRQQGLPIRKKSALVEYYASIQLLSQDQFYYAGKLAEQMLRAETLNDPPSVVHAEDIQPVFSARPELEGRLEIFEHPPYFMELEMSRLVTTGDLESAVSAMNRINTFNRARLAKEPVRSLKNSLICDCTFLARAAISGGVSPEEAFALSDKLILKIEDTQSIKKLEELEHKNLMDFVSLVHTYNMAHCSKPVREVMVYIQKHLGEKLTLAELARLVYMHPNYLSALFKKEMGIPVSRFILLRRIEEAKFFLRYTQNSVSDIASFYQFSSQSHFIRRFVEVEGITPLQYRKQSAGKAPAGRV